MGAGELAGAPMLLDMRVPLKRDADSRGPILPASLERFLDRCWSRKSAYFQRSSALLCRDPEGRREMVDMGLVKREHGLAR